MPSSSSYDHIDWAALLRNVKVVDINALRQMQEAHRQLLHFDGPAAVGVFVRLFRLVHFFAHVVMGEKRFPVLNRAFADLQWIQRHPEADEFCVTSWLLFDLPVTTDGRTVVEVFQAELAPDNADLRAFVEVTRNSRAGIYVDNGGTRQSQRLVELITGKRMTIVRGMDSQPGELSWTRIIEFNGMTYMLGDPRIWPQGYLDAVKATLIDRVISSRWGTPATSLVAAYERFMKLAGPYWMSMLYAQDEDDPLLEPDHYLSYEQGPCPELAPR